MKFVKDKDAKKHFPYFCKSLYSTVEIYIYIYILVIDICVCVCGLIDRSNVKGPTLGPLQLFSTTVTLSSYWFYGCDAGMSILGTAMFLEILNIPVLLLSLEC